MLTIIYYDYLFIDSISRFEVFVCVVKKVGSEAFLTFAGIGPYHVSENPETAIEESKLYFQDIPIDDQSDDEDKPELSEENSGEHSKTTNEHVRKKIYIRNYLFLVHLRHLIKFSLSKAPRWMIR